MINKFCGIQWLTDMTDRHDMPSFKTKIIPFIYIYIHIFSERDISQTKKIDFLLSKLIVRVISYIRVNK